MSYDPESQVWHFFRNRKRWNKFSTLAGFRCKGHMTSIMCFLFWHKNKEFKQYEEIFLLLLGSMQN